MSTEIPPIRQATEKDLSEWYAVKQQLDRLKGQESSMRKFVANGFFKDPAEGTNTFTLSDGFQLKLVHSMNRKIDEAVLTTRKPELMGLGIPVDSLVEWKPELRKSAYNKLTDDQKRAFDVVLTMSEGSPQLSIVKPAAKKGPPAGHKLEGDQ